MPHADASYFASGQSKQDIYKRVLEQAKGLLDGQRNWVSNTANVSSLLWHAYAALPRPSASVNWVGFYVRDDKFPNVSSPTTSHLPGALEAKKRKLLLGPFQGKPACQFILFGKGVCGTAAQSQKSLIVNDVLDFPGHIACDADSRSEIVVPVVVSGQAVAVIDVDCTEPAGFDDVDQLHLEELAALIADSCDW